MKYYKDKFSYLDEELQKLKKKLRNALYSQGEFTGINV